MGRVGGLGWDPHRIYIIYHKKNPQGNVKVNIPSSWWQLKYCLFSLRDALEQQSKELKDDGQCQASVGKRNQGDRALKGSIQVGEKEVALIEEIGKYFRSTGRTMLNCSTANSIMRDTLTAFFWLLFFLVPDSRKRGRAGKTFDDLLTLVETVLSEGSKPTTRATTRLLGELAQKPEVKFANNLSRKRGAPTWGRFPF